MAKMADWEWAYGEHLPEMRAEPRGLAVDVAVELFNKYQPQLTAMPAHGPEFEPLLAPAPVNEDSAQVPIAEQVKKAVQRAPYVK